MALRLLHTENTLSPVHVESSTPPVSAENANHSTIIQRAGRLSAFHAMLNGSLTMVSQTNEHYAQHSVQQMATTLAEEADLALKGLPASVVPAEHDMHAVYNHSICLRQEQSSLHSLSSTSNG